MSSGKPGILLSNLGTPDSYSVADVRKFLREFLMDPLVIDLPFISRWLLVNLIIAPFRSPKSAAEYQLLWTEQGSPLKTHSLELLNKLTDKLGEQFHLALAMRYQTPSIRNALEELRQKGCEQLLIFPLFPQYAEATTQSVFNKVSDELRLMDWQVNYKKIDSFATDKKFIEAIVSQGEWLKDGSFDHTLFSYHGLPERQLKKKYSACLSKNCCDELTDNNQHCYKAQCEATSSALVEKLGLAEQDYTICFQSRQGKIPWIKPYIEDEITKLAKRGIKNIRVFSPAFVADCLETNIEIAHTYKNLFLSLGGESLTLVESLNSSEGWIEALDNMIVRAMRDN
ncbi:MAG: ferrochelatase [Gammaproteobacteria bacterium]|nr:MAG: ferrochelatase [Gammaproteobacteria bacterium]